MDHDRFDALARMLAARGSRRLTLGALLGVLLGPTPTATTIARKRDKSKDRGPDRDNNRGQARGRDRGPDQDRGNGQDLDRLQAQGRGKGKNKKQPKKKKKKRGGSGGGNQPPPPPADGCCGADACPDPEPGSTSAGCDFAGRSFVGQDHNGSIFRRVDGRGTIFTATDNQGSVFAEACLQGARFRRARLDGSTWGDACLFGADFAGADLGGDDTLFNDALFCGTVMPDGSVNDRDCDRPTACCRTELGGGDPCQTAADCADEGCRTKACRGGNCVYAIVDDGADPGGACGAGSSGHCCEGECCQGTATECNPDGLCCAPNCSERECGPDGCGGNGTCGDCPAGQDCDEDTGQCVANCRPANCPDGCCDDNDTCQPNAVQTCGRGGANCRSCSDSEVCEDGQCVACNANCTCMGQTLCTNLEAPNVSCAIDAIGEECFCVVSRTDEPFCMAGIVDDNIVCATDADCQGLAAGAVCVDNVPGSNALCDAGHNFCAIPCCNAESCPNGCCDVSTRSCRPGNTSQACGSDGKICDMCSDAEICQNGQCVSCSPNCPCVGQNACDGLTDNVNCANDGTGEPCFCVTSRAGEQFCMAGIWDGDLVCSTDDDCQGFAAGSVCVDNVPGSFLCNFGHNFCAGPCCTAESCPNGCCDFNTRVCRPGNTNQSCGAAGKVCNVCSDLGSECIDGVCICTAQSCPNGCCDNGPGRPGVCIINSPPACGLGGALCVNCPDGAVCDAEGECCTPTCTANRCGPDGCGGRCPCPPGETCNEASGQCACTTGSCPTGQQCCNSRCLLANGGACTAASQCCSGNCFNGVCAALVDRCGSTPCDLPAAGCAGPNCCDRGDGSSCGSNCCELNHTCCQPGNNCCEPDHACCGGKCCEPSSPVCCIDACCPAGSNCCGDSCC